RRGRNCSCSCRRGCSSCLHFKRAFVDTTVHDAVEPWPALVEKRRRSEVRVAGINSCAARQQCMRECRTAIVLQWAKHWIRVDLIAGTSQNASAIIATEIVTE